MQLIVGTILAHEGNYSGAMKAVHACSDLQQYVLLGIECRSAHRHWSGRMSRVHKGWEARGGADLYLGHSLPLYVAACSFLVCASGSP